jgi:integral membrane protein (TIGR01906 family)
MPDASLTPIERAEAALVAVLVAVAIVGVTLLPLTTPLFVRTLVLAVHAERETGLSREQTLEAAEAVRRYVLDADAPPLPERLGGRTAFDAAASSHLVDVRNVLVPARRVALAAGALVLVWAMLRRRRQRLLRITVRAAIALLGGAIGLAVVIGIIDFDAFFTWFHGLFFAPGTWMFPADALLIQVFPLPFWMSAAAVWAALVLATCGLLYSCARGSCFTARTDGV